MQKASKYVVILFVALVSSVLTLAMVAISRQSVSEELYSEKIRSEMLLSEKMQLMKTMNRLNDSLGKQAERNKHLQQLLRRTKLADRQ